MDWIASMAQSQPTETSAQDRTGGCLIRLCWFVLGNIALLITAKVISSHRNSFLSWADLIFWLIVPAVIAVRYFDITRMGGRTVDGKPATMRHWRRYSVMFSAVCLLLWALAHVLARIWKQ